MCCRHWGSCCSCKWHDSSQYALICVGSSGPSPWSEVLSYEFLGFCLSVTLMCILHVMFVFAYNVCSTILPGTSSPYMYQCAECLAPLQTIVRVWRYSNNTHIFRELKDRNKTFLDSGAPFWNLPIHIWAFPQAIIDKWGKMESMQVLCHFST